MNIFDSIEYIFLRNFTIDYILIYATETLLKAKGNVFRRCIGSFWGGIIGLVFPLFEFPMWSEILIKVLSGILLCLLGFTFRNLRKFILFDLCFLSQKIVFEGIIDLISFKNLDIFIAIFLLLLSKIVSILLFQRREIIKGIFPCLLQINGKRIKLKGYYDSGNRVYYRGNPVSLLNANLLPIFVGQTKTKMIGSTYLKTMSGQTKIKIIQIDELTVYSRNKRHTIKKTMIGLDPNNSSEEFDLILHTSLLGGNDDD